MPPLVGLRNLFKLRLAKKAVPINIGEQLRLATKKRYEEVMEEDREVQQEKQNAAAMRRLEFIERIDAAFKKNFGIDFRTAQTIELLSWQKDTGREGIKQLLKARGIEYDKDTVGKIIKAVREIKEQLKKPENWPKEMMQ